MSWFFSKISADAETIAWDAAVSAAGGTLGGNSFQLADDLIKAIKAETFNAKIKYLLPLLGTNLAAARVPLRDSLAVGIATNVSFVDADFSQGTGLHGDGANKILLSGIKPSQLGVSNSGGLGFWENAANTGGSSDNVPMGCRNIGGSQFFFLETYSSVRSFYWGSGSNPATVAGAAGNNHYYGQRSSATSRELFENGTSIATNTTNDSASGAADYEIGIVGQVADITLRWAGRCAVAYMTDGTLTGTEVGNLHTLLDTYLITPTGR